MPASPLYLPTIAPSTVDQAINAMIVAGGEGPIAGSVVHRPDREAAASLLDEALRECLTEGWSFNTEHGLEIQNTATIEWLGSDNTTATLNIFVPPPNLLSFKVTQSREQEDLDFVVRPPRDWLGGPLVFYDRVLNRDGYADRTSLYIDPTWLMDYEDLPQTARNVVLLRALRRFLAQIVGDLAASDRKERDELLAYRHLKREFGNEDRFNLFGNLTTARHFGYRFFDQSTVDDRRGNRSGAVGGAGYRVTTAVTINPASFTLDSVELDEAPRVAASINLRRSLLNISLTNPSSDSVSQVVVAPNPVNLTLGSALAIPASLTLQSSSVNLLPPAPPTEVVSTVEVTPNPVIVEAPAAQAAQNNIVLVSSNVTLSSTPDAILLTAAFANGNNVAPGGTIGGTLTLNRLGGFAGSVMVSSTDPRITFPQGTTILPSVTTLQFSYTAPSNAATGSFSGQIVGTASGLPQTAASYTVQIGTPVINYSLGTFGSPPTIGQMTIATLAVTRTNYTGIVYFAADIPMNVSGADVPSMNVPYLAVAGTGVTQIERGAGNGYSILSSGTSSATLYLILPNSWSGPSVTFTLSLLGDGPQAVSRQYTFAVGSGGTGSNTVTSVQVTPNPFSVAATTGAAATPADVAVASANVSLTLS